MGGEDVSDGDWNDFTVDAGGYALAVRDYGGEGRPLVLIHGNGTNVCEWELLAPLLVDYFHVIAYDVNGYGHSEFSGDWSEQYLDIERVATALELDRPIPVGQSMGALLATEYAANVPDCPAVVAVEGFHLRAVDASRDPWDDRFLARLAFGSFLRAITGAEGRDWAQLPSGPIIQTELDDHLQEMRRLANDGRFNGVPVETLASMIRRSRVARLDGLLYPTPTREQGALYIQHRKEQVERDELPTIAIYGHIKCPGLFVGATRGPYASERATIDNLSNANRNLKLDWLESGHMIPLEKPEELASLIVDFLEVGLPNP